MGVVSRDFILGGMGGRRREIRVILFLFDMSYAWNCKYFEKRYECFIKVLKLFEFG